jgi:RHS repeat-associated protein
MMKSWVILNQFWIRLSKVIYNKANALSLRGGLGRSGFTGNEHLDEFGLINMNGRIYDPAIAMFLSPDNYVQMPFSTQGYNRYILSSKFISDKEISSSTS